MWPSPTAEPSSVSGIGASDGEPERATPDSGAAAPSGSWSPFGSSEPYPNTDTDARPWAPPERSTPPAHAAWAPAAPAAAAPESAAAPEPAESVAEQPIIASPYAPPVEPISAEPTFAAPASDEPVAVAAAPVGAAPATSGDVPATRGETRMREDSEVVAQARAAFAEPAEEAPLAAPVDEAAGPIVVPGASGILPGVVPPPPVPTLTGDPGRGGAAANVGEYHPRLRRDRSEHDDFELSNEVSAIAGAPAAGEPRSAMAAVSAQVADAPAELDDDLESTMLAVRRRPTWRLQLPMSARPVDVTGTSVVLGRRPAASDGPAGAQLVPVADGTRTISKTHARLDLVDGVWMITDLGSTNGVVLLGDGGEETELAAHATAAVTETFLLGDAELRLTSQTA